ncbi:DUF4157 domain-containing protein [Rhizobium ruizarguesonis]
MRLLIFNSVLLTLSSTISFGCDPNEDCNRCLASAFGSCITHGNDPVCEVRKKACQISPPLADAPGSPFGPGGPLAKGGPLPTKTINDCVADISKCPGAILSQVTADVLRPIVSAYISSLEQQANGKWQTIPASYLASAQQYYSVDLHQVRYATNINTLHGQAITIGYEVFFPENIDFNTRAGTELVSHELEHVVQYANRGGINPFIAEYVAKSAGQVISKRSFSVHDYVDLEAAANAKQDQVADAIYGWEFKISNNCPGSIHMAVDYQELDDQWNVEGYWDLDPGVTTLLSNTNGNIHSRNQIYDFYAVSGAATYSGPYFHVVPADNQTLGFRRKQVDMSADNEFWLNIDCK